MEQVQKFYFTVTFTAQIEVESKYTTENLNIGDRNIII